MTSPKTERSCIFIQEYGLVTSTTTLVGTRDFGIFHNAQGACFGQGLS